MWSQDKYQQALDFAATAHGQQQVPGKAYSYVVHLANVCMEVLAALPVEADADGDLAMQCALLHDTIEDTDVSPADLAARFGQAVAGGVLALSKRKELAGAQAMADSLQRIGQQPREVGMVKLADRITNLQRPPQHWSREKISAYRQEAVEILAALGHCSGFLAKRLERKIAEYGEYLEE